jgi:hypothetical protein
MGFSRKNLEWSRQQQLDQIARRVRIPNEITTEEVEAWVSETLSKKKRKASEANGKPYVFSFTQADNEVYRLWSAFTE